MLVSLMIFALIYVKICDYRICALIDTGSTSSILGFEGLVLLQKLEIPLKYDDHLNVTTADVSYRLVLLELTSLGKYYQEIKVISGSFSHPPRILGMNFEAFSDSGKFF